MEFKTSMLIMDLKKGIKIYLKDKQKDLERSVLCYRENVKDLSKDLKTLRKIKRKTTSTKVRIRDLKSSIQSNSYTINDILSNGKTCSCNALYNEIKKLRKSSHIIGIEVIDEAFQVYTKPLIVKKKNIGSYTIIIPFKGKEIYIFNKNIPEGECQHWFVSEHGEPCYGDWKKGIFESLEIGDLGMVILNLIQFLLSTYRSYDGYITFSEFSINDVNKTYNQEGEEDDEDDEVDEEYETD